jgi:flagellar protein FlaG
MALDAISNSAYHEAAKSAGRPRVEMTLGQETTAGTINIAEVPSRSPVTGYNGTEKDGGQNQGQGNALKDKQAYDQQVKDAVSQVNSKLKMHRTRCEFSYHEETKRVSIKVMDKETNEIIREIPPEQTLEMVQKAWELAGFLIDEKR